MDLMTVRYIMIKLTVTTGKGKKSYNMIGKFYNKDGHNNISLQFWFPGYIRQVITSPAGGSGPPVVVGRPKPTSRFRFILSNSSLVSLPQESLRGTRSSRQCGLTSSTSLYRSSGKRVFFFLLIPCN